MVKIFEDTFIRFDMIHERDGGTDTQTPHDGICRAYEWHRAAKMHDEWYLQRFKSYIIALTENRHTNAGVVIIV